MVNIKLCSPFGEAHFEAPIEAIANFLDRTYGIVPMGRESAVIDIDGELEQPSLADLTLGSQRGRVPPGGPPPATSVRRGREPPGLRAQE